MKSAIENKRGFDLKDYACSLILKTDSIYYEYKVKN